MNHIVFGAIVITIGCAALVFREVFARQSIDYKNWLFNMRMGEKDVMTNRRVTLAFGVIAIIVGILVLLDIIKIRS